VGIAAGAYGLYAAFAWLRYGSVPPATARERDELLDRFMPVYDIVERHHVRVEAPADVTLAAAREQDLRHLPLVSLIFRARELALRAAPDDRPQPRGLLAATLALGWGVLAEVPGREIVVGAVTRPWEANVTFRALAPGDFESFSEPGFVKIAWTLGRSGRRRGFGLPHGNPRRCHRRECPRAFSPILGFRVARHRLDPVALPPAAQAGRREEAGVPAVSRTSR
jgi:hypothetical protein